MGFGEGRPARVFKTWQCIRDDGRQLITCDLGVRTSKIVHRKSKYYYANTWICQNTEMRAVIQRVNEASITINGSMHAKIGMGLLILIGIEDSDNRTDIEWLAGKIARLRIFNDENGVMNLSVLDISGEIMVVSQFTLHASTVKGNRPSYYRASKPEFAVPLYNDFVTRLEETFGRSIKTGIFGADMKISLLNDGPVTLFIDTKNRE